MCTTYLSCSHPAFTFSLLLSSSSTFEAGFNPTYLPCTRLYISSFPCIISSHAYTSSRCVEAQTSSFGHLSNSSVAQPFTLMIASNTIRLQRHG